MVAKFSAGIFFFGGCCCCCCCCCFTLVFLVPGCGCSLRNSFLASHSDLPPGKQKKKQSKKKKTKEKRTRSRADRGGLK